MDWFFDFIYSQDNSLLYFFGFCRFCLLFFSQVLTITYLYLFFSLLFVKEKKNNKETLGFVCLVIYWLLRFVICFCFFTVPSEFWEFVFIGFEFNTNLLMFLLGIMWGLVLVSWSRVKVMIFGVLFTYLVRSILSIFWVKFWFLGCLIHLFLVDLILYLDETCSRMLRF